MANYKEYDYDQTMMVAVSLSEQLMPGTLEYGIHHLIENRVNMSIFNQRYKNDMTGAPAYDPKILLKVILAGYARGLIHSRKIERACRENIIFMALCCGKVPDHTTICNFVKNMETEIIQVFLNILMVCDEQGLLGGTRFALDGCKLPSNASQEWSGTHAQLRKKMERIENRVQKIVKKHISQDAQIGITLPENVEQKIEQLNRDMDKIQRFLNENPPKAGSKKKEIKSNITDNESAQMKTPHGTIQGYNAQALVDSKHQIIISCEVAGEGSDHNQVTPLLDQAKTNLSAIGKPEDYFEGKQLLCDASYHSQENLSKAHQEKVDAHIPDVNYRKRDPRLHKKDEIPFCPADFSYDEAADQYICPNGAVLKLSSSNVKKGVKLYRLYVASKSDCSGCPFRKRCLATEKTTRRYYYVYQDKAADQVAREMYQKLSSEEGLSIYHQRTGIVEPVFGNLRSQKRLDRFTLRGKTKVDTQWRLYAMIQNIEKIVKYGSGEAFCPAFVG